MADAIVHENTLEFNGKKYFRAGSSELGIGSVGEKRTPIAKANYLEPKDHLRAAKIKIHEIGPVKIDSQRTSKKDFLASISVAKVFKLFSVDHAYEDVRDNKLSLIFFSVETSDMVRAINDSPAIREDLKRWGNDARVVTSGFTIVKAETAKHFASSTSAEAEVTVDSITINPKLTVSSGGDTTVSFPRGSYFAYGLSSIEWDDKNEKHANRVVDLKTDQPGL